MTQPAITALILAGRRPNGQDPLAQIDVPHKALLDFCGKPMIAYVLEALANTPHVGRILISAPQDLRAALTAAAGTAPITFIEARPTPATSIGAALDEIGDNEPLLVTTCDHALLLPQMVSQFIKGALEKSADVSAACVTQSAYRAAFGDAPRTFITLSDIAFSGANLFLIRPQRGRALIAFWQRLEANRKNPLTMARQIGVLTGLRYLIGRLSKQAAFDALEAKTGARCGLIALEDASAAIDVDKPCDIPLVQSILEKRRKSG